MIYMAVDTTALGPCCMMHGSAGKAALVTVAHDSVETSSSTSELMEFI